MAGQSSVKIFCGDLPKYFPFGPTAALSTTTNQVSQAIYKESVHSTFQAILTGTGAVTGTVNIQGSDDYWTGSGFEVALCNTTSGSAVVTTAANGYAGGIQTDLGQVTPPVAVGMVVVGPGIPAGAYVLTVTNAGSITLSANATVTASNVALQFFRTNWAATALGTITLTGTISATAPSFTDGFSSITSWRYVRANVSNVTGTGATVQVVMGV